MNSSLAIVVIFLYFAITYLVMHMLSTPDYLQIRWIVFDVLNGVGYILAGGLIYTVVSKTKLATVYMCAISFILSHLIYRALYTSYIYINVDRSGFQVFLSELDVHLLSFALFLPIAILLGLLGRTVAKNITGLGAQ